MIELLHCDCMDYMRDLPDKAFDLAIVDPPYGIERFKKGGSRINKYGVPGKWNNSKPTDKYFNELFRVSCNQIIWGANYFSMKPTKCFLIWDKQQPECFSFASCEYAWASFEKPAKTYYQRPQNMDFYCWLS